VRSRRLKRPLLLLSLFLVGLIVLIAVLPNLIFLTARGRSLIEKQVEKRIGLSTQINSLSWSPWNGFSARDLTIQTPKNPALKTPVQLLKISSIQAQPYWASFLKGKPAIRTLEINHPIGQLPIELVAALIEKEKSTFTPPKVPTQKKLATAKKSTSPEEKTSPPVKAPKKPAKPNPSPQPSGPSEPEEKIKPRIPDTTIIIKDGSIRLYSLQDKIPPLALQDLNAHLPWRGSQRSGQATFSLDTSPLFESARLLQKSDSLAFHIPLELDKGILKSKTQPIHYKGNKFNFDGQLMTRRPFPYRLSLQNHPETQSLSLDLPEQLTKITSSSFSSYAIADGYLQNPSSLRANINLSAKNLDCYFGTRGLVHQFEDFRLICTLQNSTLQIPLARLYSEGLSFMANAYLLPGGQAGYDTKGVIRIVTSEEHLSSISKFWRGILLSSTRPRDFQPLLNSNARYYRDIHWHMPTFISYLFPRKKSGKALKLSLIPLIN